MHFHDYSGMTNRSNICETYSKQIKPLQHLCFFFPPSQHGGGDSPQTSRLVKTQNRDGQKKSEVRTWYPATNKQTNKQTNKDVEHPPFCRSSWSCSIGFTFGFPHLCQRLPTRVTPFKNNIMINTVNLREWNKSVDFSPYPGKRWNSGISFFNLWILQWNWMMKISGDITKRRWDCSCKMLQTAGGSLLFMMTIQICPA